MLGRGVLLLVLSIAAVNLYARQLQLDLQQLRWGVFSVDTLQLHQATAKPAAGQAAATVPLWSLRLHGLAVADALRLDARLDCLQSSPVTAAPDVSIGPDWLVRTELSSLLSCTRGTIALQAAASTEPTAAVPAQSISGQFSYNLASATLQLELPTLAFSLQPDARWSLRLQQLPLDWLQQVVNVAGLAQFVAQWAGMDLQLAQQLPWPRSGQLDAVLTGQLPRADSGAASAAAWQADVQLQQLTFDNAAGDIAADGVDLQLQIDAGMDAQQHWEFSAVAQWLAGEWLFGAFYLPPPATPVRLAVDGSWQTDAAAGSTELQLQRLQWQHAEVIELQASAHWRWFGSEQRTQQTEAVSTAALLPAGWHIDKLQIALPAFQQAYLNGWLQTRSLADVIQSGALRMQSSGSLSAQSVQHDSHLVISDVALQDPGGRLAVSGLHADIHWPYQQASATASEPSRLGWQSLHIGKLPVAATALAFELSGPNLLLQRNSLMPILDGGILLRDLHLQRMFSADAELVLDAEIVPLSLRRLGDIMDWPEFGGQLSGSIPGIRREQGVWLLNGQIELELFQGRAVISGLGVERPFGVLPVLQADVWVERLQLEPLTEAFDIGRISGPVDAYIRDLRLLNWQPVSFNAWLRTSARPKVPLRISQRAVDTLSSVGGGIGSGLQVSMLRLFESFRYQRLGISCQLSYGICEMDGIEDAADGQGFLLVKGGGLPHLDVVAYNRRVDWQRLLTQLQAAIKSQGAKVQ